MSVPNLEEEEHGVPVPLNCNCLYCTKACDVRANTPTSDFPPERDDIYIDLTTIHIFDNTEISDPLAPSSGRRVSMSAMRAAIDAYESVGFQKGVKGILMTEEQYYSYERTLWDFIQSYKTRDNLESRLPPELTFDGKTVYIDKYVNFYKDLDTIVDDGTTTMNIPTPEGWKCPRKICDIEYNHTHRPGFGITPD